jgi:hypothetical protein
MIEPSLAVLINGEKYGPYSESELREYIDKQSIVGSDLVLVPSGEWIPVSRWKEAKAASPKVYDSDRTRNYKTPLEELSVLCWKILADAVVREDEARSLHKWIVAHPKAAESWPANAIADRLSEIMADGIIEELELAELKGVLEVICTSQISAMNGSIGTKRVPYDDPMPELIFTQKKFCFSGQFAFGAISSCERTVRKLGGGCNSEPRKGTDFLVIGRIGKPNWATIERAIALRADGGEISLVSEENWQQAVWSARSSDAGEVGEILASETIETSRITLYDGSDLRFPNFGRREDAAIQVESSSGNGCYSVNLSNISCTCPDFSKRRRSYDSNSIQRACKHVCIALSFPDRLTQLTPLLRSIVSDAAERGKGVMMFNGVQKLELAGDQFLVSPGLDGWVNIFGPDRTGTFASFGYSLQESRWSYRISPKHSQAVAMALRSFDWSKTANAAAQNHPTEELRRIKTPQNEQAVRLVIILLVTAAVIAFTIYFIRK